MRHRMLPLLAATLAALFAIDGRATARTYEKNLVVVHGGMNIAFYQATYGSVSGATSPRIGYYTGVTDLLLLHRRTPLYLETGLLFSSRGGRYSGLSARPMYLQVPLGLHLRIRCGRNIRLSPHIGAWYAFGLGGKLRHADGWADLFDGDAALLHRSDFGLRVGVTLVWRRLRVETGYEPGFCNLARPVPPSSPVPALPLYFSHMQNHCFSIGLGYEF